MRHILFIGFLVVSTPLLINNNISSHHYKNTLCPDTLRAQVSYTDNWLLSESVVTDKNVMTAFIDSVIQNDVDSDFGKQIYYIKKHLTKTPDQLIYCVDSLLQLNPVPYALINELNRYLIYYSYEEDYSVISEKENHIEQFPGNDVYGNNWSTNHPFNYPENLSDSDSLVLLNLKQQMSNYFHHPVSAQTIRKYGGKIESPFGWRDGRRHNGVDIALDRWDTVHNTFPGKVRFAKNYSSYGKVVIVRHHNGLETLYAHLQMIKVKSGQEIKAGDIVGLGGNTGNAEGSHLHFEIRYKGIALNPANIIDFNHKELLSDSLILRKSNNNLVALPVGITYHTVERGDYPLKIAQRYGISVQVLCKINNLGPRTRLRIGQQLRITDKK